MYHFRSLKRYVFTGSAPCRMTQTAPARDASKLDTSASLPSAQTPLDLSRGHSSPLNAPGSLHQHHNTNLYQLGYGCFPNDISVRLFRILCSQRTTPSTPLSYHTPDVTGTSHHPLHISSRYRDPPSAMEYRRGGGGGGTCSRTPVPRKARIYRNTPSPWVWRNLVTVLRTPICTAVQVSQDAVDKVRIRHLDPNAISPRCIVSNHQNPSSNRVRAS